jgi:hypothetical protein
VIPLIAAVALAAVFAAGAAAQDGPPGPSAGELLVGGLLQPKGMEIGPDGMLYVAESGTGGDTTVIVEGAETKVGSTGRISKIDLETGARTTVLDGLPSSLGPVGDAVGPADVAFLNNQLYYLQTHGGEAYGFPDTPTGIYRIDSNGNADLIADIGEFNIDDPVDTIVSGEKLDIEPGGNPFSMIVRDGAFYVADGNQEQIIRVDTNGDITRIAQFGNSTVSTGLAQESESGPLYLAMLGGAPFLPENGKVLRIALPGGAATEIASGASMLTDLGFAPNGQLYALQFNDTVEAGEALFAPFTGKVLRVNDDGTFTPIVTGLTFTARMLFDGDTLYVNDDSINALGQGEIWRIENFSSIQPPAPTPTAAPTQAPAATPTAGTGVIAPDTGTGGYASDGAGNAMLVLAVTVAAAAIIANAGAALAWKRR